MGNTQRDHPRFKGAFGKDGEVLCSCKPRANAILLETRKAGNNQGRWFYKCDAQPDSKKCKLFLWDDDAEKYRSNLASESGGHRLGGSSQSQSQPPSSSSKSDFHSHSTPAPSRTAIPTSNGKKRELAIEEDDDDDDDVQFSSGLATPSPSPMKKKLAFGSDLQPTSTPGSQYSSILADPDNPFHTVHKKLWQPSSLSPPDSAGVPLPESGSIDAVLAGLANLSSRVEALKEGQEKSERLLAAGKKEKELLRGVNEKLKREVEGLKERVRMLEEENGELKTRLA